MDVEDAIVELLRAGSSGVRSLFSRFSRATVYAALRRLRSRGAVVPGEKAGIWQLTGEGQAVELSSGPVVEIVWPELPGAGRHLAVLPSREHLSLGRLILLAATARRFFEHHHASFLLYSASGLRGKTFVGRWATLVLGAAPSALVHAGAESGRSLSVRRRSTGAVAAVRAALSGPLLCVDEFLRGQVKATCMLLISGDRSVPLEEESMIVNAVVMLLMNSRPDARTPEEATTLDAAMLRRCFASDLERVVLDASFARDGEERLDRVRAMGAVTLPDIRAGMVEERVVRDRIADALEAVLDSPERMGSLDLVMLGQFAVAACAWGLSVDDAVALVVRDAATVWATTGWTAEGWEQALAEMFLVEETGEEPVEEPTAMEVMDYDYEARLVAVDRAVRDASVGLDDLPALLRDGAALRSLGLDAAHAPGVAGALRIVRGPDGNAEDATARLRVLTALDEHGLEPAEAERMIGMAAAGRDALGLGPEDAVLLMRGVVEAGLEPGEVGGYFVEMQRELGRLDGMIVETRRELRGWRRQRLEAAEEVVALRRRVVALARVLERVEREPELAAALGLAEQEVGREVLEQVLAAAAKAGCYPDREPGV